MNPSVIAYGSLALAIVAEVTATSFLQRSEQFSKLLPSIITVIGYGISFFFLSQALKLVPLGFAYAMWGGLGIVLTATIGVVVFRQSLDTAAIIGIGLIVGGVVVMNVFSQSGSH